MQKPQTLKGFRDFLPVEKRVRDMVTNRIKEIFERFGFEPLETPTLEYASLLLGKYGDEADKLLYTFEDRGGRAVALRYDQTVPTARVLAQYQHELPRFFRRYQIQNVFRADKPQKGRFREFTQCDIDIFGTTAPVADAEVIACTYAVFKHVGYPEVHIRFNDRAVLFAALQEYATPTLSIFSIIQSIDKLDKIGVEGVTQELVKKGVSKKDATSAIEKLRGAAMTDSLKAIIEYAQYLGVPSATLKFTPELARGLDYYTGVIFEVTVPQYGSGALGGGGRYDHLVKQLGGVDVPAVGIAFGFDRMVEAAQELNIFKGATSGTKAVVFFLDNRFAAEALSIAQQLRLSGVNSEVYPTADKLNKQLKYALARQVRYAVFIGEQEFSTKTVAIKDLKTKKQSSVARDKTAAFITRSQELA